MDLVIVDTSVNDVPENFHGTSQVDALPIQQLTETLISLLIHDTPAAKLMPPAIVSNASKTFVWNGVGCIYLGTSTRTKINSPWTGHLPRLTDAVHFQLPVAIHHGVRTTCDSSYVLVKSNSSIAIFQFN